MFLAIGIHVLHEVAVVAVGLDCIRRGNHIAVTDSRTLATGMLFDGAFVTPQLC